MKRGLLTCAMVAFATGAGPSPRAADTKFWSLEDAPFRRTAQGRESAILWGDPDAGAYGMLVRYPAGSGRGWHTHPNPVHLVVISGTWVVQIEGGVTREITAGGGSQEGAGVVHAGRCKEGAPCVFLLTGEKKLSTQMVALPGHGEPVHGQPADASAQPRQ